MSNAINDKEIIAKIVANPLNYQVTVDGDSVNIYDKSNGDTFHMEEAPDRVLVDLFNAIGAEAEIL